MDEAAKRLGQQNFCFYCVGNLLVVSRCGLKWEVAEGHDKWRDGYYRRDKENCDGWGGPARALDQSIGLILGDAANEEGKDGFVVETAKLCWFGMSNNKFGAVKKKL